MIFGPLRGRSDCCVHLGGVPLPLVQQHRSLCVVLPPTLSWRLHVDFLCSRGDRLFHQASAWCLGGSLPLSFSSSVFVTYVLSSASFGLGFIADDPPALQQFDLALRRCCRHLLGWPSASPVAAVHWELGIGDALHLAFGALSPFSGACVLLTTPPLALRSRAVCSGSPRLRWVPGHTGARPLSTLSPSRFLPTWASLLGLRPRHSTGGSPEKSVLVSHRALRHRLSAMVSDLHGVLVGALSLTTSSLTGRTPRTPSTCLPLPFVFWVLLVGAMTTPPQAVPLVTGRVLPPAPFAMTRTAPLCFTSPFAYPTAMPELPGLIPAASHRPTFQRLNSTAGCSTNLTSRTRRRQSGPTLTLLGSFANGTTFLVILSRSSHTLSPSGRLVLRGVLRGSSSALRLPWMAYTFCGRLPASLKRSSSHSALCRGNVR